MEDKTIEEKSKNPKRVEAGKRLAENNKKIKDFYNKNSKQDYTYPIIIGVSLLGICYFLYNKQRPKEIQQSTPESTKRVSKHILYD